jgi:hypothetical protein
MTDDERSTEQPEHKHQEDQVFGKEAAARQETVDRELDEVDGEASNIEDDGDDRPPEPHAGGRA